MTGDITRGTREMPSADMIKLAEKTMRTVFKEQMRRLIDGGFPNATIYGNFGASASDHDDTKPTVWCNVNVHGDSNPGYGYTPKQYCGLADLAKTITGMLAEVPLEKARANLARKSGLAIGYLKETDQIAKIDAAFKEVLEPCVYEMLSRDSPQSEPEAEAK